MATKALAIDQGTHVELCEEMPGYQVIHDTLSSLLGGAGKDRQALQGAIKIVELVAAMDNDGLLFVVEDGDADDRVSQIWYILS